MTEFPYLLGNNAPGFPHVFVGSPVPWNVWIGRVHARVVYGGLAQSSYTDIVGAARGRLASGIVAVFTPRGAPGLELGATRFFHTVWPDSGIGSRELRRPFETFFKSNLRSTHRDAEENQLASVFGRWVLPHSGFEVYGEYGREDHNADTRDLVQEPDHDATYALGLQKAWTRPSGSIIAVRGELVNSALSTLARHREQIGPYIHYGIRQGHTNRGQLLATGFAAGTGGSGTSVRLERYTESGSESVQWYRLVLQDRSSATAMSARCYTACLDVQYVLRAERLRAYGKVELRYSLAFVYEMNRDFTHDAINWNPQVELRWHP
jgi:hypothetical protein